MTLFKSAALALLLGLGACAIPPSPRGISTPIETGMTMEQVGAVARRSPDRASQGPCLGDVGTFVLPLPVGRTWVYEGPTWGAGYTQIEFTNKGGVWRVSEWQ